MTNTPILSGEDDIFRSNIISIIDRAIYDYIVSLESQEINEKLLYEYITHTFSHLDISPIGWLIRQLITLRIKEHTATIENQYLRIEIARLLNIILSMDKDSNWSPSSVFPVLWISQLPVNNYSELLLHSQKRIQYFHQRIDFLTGLPNYIRCLEDMAENKNRSIVLFHINNMFDINNTFWRSTWDDIVIKISKLLQRYCRENSLQKASVYKFEGTDFGLVFEWDVSKQIILDQYDRIKDLKVFDSKSKTDIHLSFSLWVVFDWSNIEILLHKAFHALKIARSSRKIIFFNNKNIHIDGSWDFFKIRKLVREAFNEDLFELCFQEIKKNPRSIRKRDARKFECLIRMYDSKERINLIPPLQFLHVIKRDGKNQALTNIVIQKACEFMQKNPGDFSINLTEDDLQSDGFALRMYEIFSKYSISPDRVTFEILEEIEWVESSDILTTLSTLRRYGFEIAIDDFGSWYSNFSRMLDFRPNSLKIDMKYVRGIEINQQHQSLIKAIVWIAHDNGMYVVAEWVETPNEQLALEILWVDYSQWYLIGRPLPYILNTDI